MPRGGFRENAGRKSGWNHSETQVIRVPKAFACQLLEIAKKLDSGECLDFVSESKNAFVSLTDSPCCEVDSKMGAPVNLGQATNELIALSSIKNSEEAPGQMSLLGLEADLMETKGNLEEFSLPISELGRRWNQTTPAITRAKKEKSREEFIRYSRKKEQSLGNDFAWEYLPQANRFQPVDISPEDLHKLRGSYQRLN